VVVVGVEGNGGQSRPSGGIGTATGIADPRVALDSTRYIPATESVSCQGRPQCGAEERSGQLGRRRSMMSVQLTFYPICPCQKWNVK
jgi:hypothetical protein